ncbi:MAG: CPBP family intramembrane metalloprotease [Deinococcus sp.]|nr:CPBP family intramembrane metalloprotease [Deinococcus sp.]
MRYLLGTLVLLVTGQLVALELVARRLDTFDTLVVVSPGVTSLVLVYLLLLAHRPRPELLRLALPSGRQMLAAVAFGLAALAGQAALGTLLLVLFPDLARHPEMLGTETRDLLAGVPLVQRVLVAALLVPALEELLFRGYLQGRLGGRWRAVLPVSVVFALLHPGLLSTPYIFLFSLGLGYMVEGSSSVWTAVLGHVVNNGVVLAIGAAGPSPEQVAAIGPQLLLELPLPILLAAAGPWYMWREFRWRT